MKLDTQEQVNAAERVLRLSWVIVFGAVLYSVLTVTPLVQRVTPDGWGLTAPILPIVVDAAVVIVVRVDAIVARLDGDAGFWPALLRWLTGVMTLALNVGDSALSGDMVGVGVHAVAPILLIVTAEAGLKWRRAITTAVERIEREHREEVERERAEREAREQRERDEREQERAVRERAEREEREHAERLERERTERAARERREEREHAAALEREKADREARERQEEREHAERLRREQHERDERERREQQERQASEHRERQKREHPKPGAVNTSKTKPVNTPQTDDKMPEADARAAVARGVMNGASVRELVELTGWSIGWVTARRKEAHEPINVPGQTELEVAAA
ncbi:hypothetical protein AN217_03160 [Streptomyces qinglanensis]|uniref:DUF2637 domain-containing protein n=1 Tax=Streptomyces qinglanensis TaxID=943816 RepID=A0A1E7KEA3_9ACTN|nr:hypothetical protein [Streptomyces qinglanensis]OEV02251.1 hypothetical protein AN217_03160 [Streptomyces qinglanensis]OEV26994.1 hypothetical protein AN220_06260 [Streptomyces nanshensis]